MPLKKLIKNGVLVSLILLLGALSGCSTKTIQLYPIQGTDFYIKENGDVCMSEYYFKEVLQAELKAR